MIISFDDDKYNAPNLNLLTFKVLLLFFYQTFYCISFFTFFKVLLNPSKFPSMGFITHHEYFVRILL